MGQKPYPYDPEIADIVWSRIALSTTGLYDVLDGLKKEGFTVPSPATWYRWMESVPEMREKSARAREMQADYIVGLAVKHAMNDRVGEKVKVGKDGTEITTGDNVERSKLIYQALMRRAGQLNPKVYGEKVQAELTGKDGGPITFQVERIGAALPAATNMIIEGEKE